MARTVTCYLVVGLLALAAGGCGVVATPYTIVKSVEMNRWTRLRGQVLDESGKPLGAEVRLLVSYQRYAWHPFIWDYRSHHEQVVRPNWKGEFDFSVYRNEGDEIRVGIVAPGKQVLWFLAAEEVIWLEDTKGTWSINGLAFKKHPDLRAEDKLRFTLQSASEPHEPRLPQRVGEHALTHASRILSLEGESEKDVVARFGEPDEVRTAHFLAPTYRLPGIPPGTDRQLIYGRIMSHIYVYMRDKRVVLALEEWSDY